MAPLRPRAAPRPRGLGEGVVNPDDLARILDELASRLGPGGEYVFGLAVRQALIDGIIGTVVGTVILLAAVVGIGKAIGLSRSQLADNTEFMDVAFPWVFGGIIAMVPVGFGAMSLGSGLSKLLNPEYAALTDILSRIVP